MRRNHKFEQELWQAIQGLASSSDNIKERLEKAYQYHLIYLDPQSIPQKQNRDKFTKAINKLTKKETMAVADAIHHLPLKSCRTIVSDLCDVYRGFVYFEWDLQPEAGNGTVPPLRTSEV